MNRDAYKRGDAARSLLFNCNKVSSACASYTCQNATQSVCMCTVLIAIYSIVDAQFNKSG